jgi:hypothetical protein
MDFEVLFEDGEIWWLPYNLILSLTKTPGLRNLLNSDRNSTKIIYDRNSTLFLSPGDVV